MIDDPKAPVGASPDRGAGASEGPESAGRPRPPNAGPQFPSQAAAELGVDREALRQYAAALGLSLADAPLDQLVAYLVLLRKWNAAYNLTAVRDTAQMRVQHFADCLAVVGPLRRELGRRPLRILDVGSGGGLPGVVLAVVEPTWDVSCVDSVGKKAAFIRQVAGELALPSLHALHARVEALPGPPFDVIVARAFASLPDFVRLTRPLLAPAGAWLAMKGRHPGDELTALPADIDVFHVERLAIPGLAAERCLVWMRPR